MTNEDAARALVAAGIPTFACCPSGEERKRPRPGVLWRSASSSDLAAVTRMWARHPGSAPAIDLGKTRWLVIDCDRKPGAVDGVQWFRDWCEAEGFDLSATPIVVTPSKGWHVYFRQPAGHPLTNARGALPPKDECGVDVRGAGGYVIAPGAQMDVGAYEYLDGNCPIDSAQPAPDWLVSTLRGRAPEPRPAVTAAPPVARPSASAAHGPSLAREEAYARAALDGECREVASTGEGGRNMRLNIAAVKLGHQIAAGRISESEVVAALTEAASTCGLSVMEAAKTIRSGLAAGMREPAPPLGENGEADAVAAELARQLIEAYDGTLHDAATGEIVEPIAAPPVADEMPAHLLHPPGLVGEIAAWICATARRPQPALAVAAALTIVGTACGRQFAGPSRSGTHLYALGLAPTGAGKDHPLQCIRRAMKAAGLHAHLGPDDFTSASALVRHIYARPLSVCPMDEFGAFLAKVNAKKASTHEKLISAVLRKAWGASFGVITTPEYASVSSQEIEAPALSIYGTSTPEEFFRALEEADIANGVLNRFLLVASAERPAERDPEMDPGQVPPALIDGLKAIAHHSGDLWVSGANLPRLDRIQVTVPWARASTRAGYEALGARVEAMGRASPATADYMARTTEMALRIATIIAIGRSPTAMIGDADMAYGAELALWSAETMQRLGREHMAGSETQALARKVIRIIRQAGGRIRKRDLVRKLDHAARWRDIEQVITALTEGGEIEREQVRPPEGQAGRPTETYRLL